MPPTDFRYVAAKGKEISVGVVFAVTFAHCLINKKEVITRP